MVGSFFSRNSSGVVLFFCFGACTLLTARADESNVFGSLSTRYRLRTTGSTHDNDLTTFLSLNAGEPLTDRLSASLEVGGIFDLDGTDSNDSTYGSVYDTYSDDQLGRIYHAYIDANDLKLFDRLRAGRQFHHEFESVYFDGLSLTWRQEKGFRLITYGGIPVHFFDTQNGYDKGDWVAGGAIELDPLKVFRVRLDYLHYDSDEVDPQTGLGGLNDNLFGASAWWDVSTELMLSSRFTAFSEQARDLAFDALYRQTEKQFSARFHIFSLLQEYGTHVVDLDPYTVAGQYEPYVETMVSATKGFGEHFAVDVGYSLRKLLDEQVGSEFNHGYHRVFLTGSTTNLPIDGMRLSATGDLYLGEDNTQQNDVYATSLGIEQELFERKLRLIGGTAFYLYRYNLLTGDESDNARTYFVRIVSKPWKSIEGRLGYEFETNDFDNFHTMDARVAWTF